MANETPNTSAPTPNVAPPSPAPSVPAATPPEAPTLEPAGLGQLSPEEQAAMDRNLAEFLGFEMVPADATKDQNNAQPPASAPGTPPAAPAQTPPPAPANAAQPPAANGAPAATPDFDPLIVAMLTGTQAAPNVETPPAAPAPQPAPAAAAPQASTGTLQGPPPPAPSGQPETWAPFDPRFELPDEIRSAIFESDDPKVQARALVSVITSVANLTAQQTLMRVRDVYAPAFEQQIFQRAAQAEQMNAVHRDFYGAHQDLQPYPQVVGNAFKVLAQANPNAPYDQALRDRVANLAREFLKRTGVIAAPANLNPQPAPAQPQPTPDVFTANGARPDSFGSPPDPNSPESIVRELSW